MRIKPSRNFTPFVIVSGIIASIYFVFYKPLTNIEDYKKIQQESRANIIPQDIQPGNMRIWSDPFEERKDI